MAYATVDFDDGRTYVQNRPKGSLILHGPGGWYGGKWAGLALVDTGADYAQLPITAAQGVGISLNGATPYKVITAGGTVVIYRLSVSLEIEGVKVQVPVDFGQNPVPLIGRQAIFQVLDNLGFSTTEWLLDYHQMPAQQGGGSTAQSQTQTPGQPQPLTPFTDKLESAVSLQPGQPANRIRDHGSWIAVGGIRLSKRQLVEAVEATQQRPDDETWNRLLGDVVL